MKIEDKTFKFLILRTIILNNTKDNNYMFCMPKMFTKIEI